MANAMVGHMKKQGVKTVGFLGYTDAYGEQWLQALTPLLEKAGIKLLATERFARADTSVTAQALKLTAANPDAMLVVASGRARPCRTGPGGARLQGQDLPDPRRGHARPDARGRQGRRRHLRHQRPGGRGRAAARQPPQQGAGREVQRRVREDPPAPACATSLPATPTTPT
jgi:hypothetical protein